VFQQDDFMLQAIKEAMKGQAMNEVPVGAIIVNEDKKIIARAHNLVEKYNNPMMHAEKLVIEQALKVTKNRYLENCEIWVTLEPCMMCLGMIKLARIKRLYYGAQDKSGNFKMNDKKKSSKQSCKHSFEIYSGFSAEKCENLLKCFFKNLR
tara:strand:+ start:357 stop:809 length:453 start_codon:yes stop_codon:yes gene_type:complete